MSAATHGSWRTALDRRARGGWRERLRHPLRTSFPTTAELRERRHRGLGATSTARTFWGQPMTIALPEEVSIAIHRHGFVDYDLTAYLLAHLRDGATILDVGAHIGYYTMLTSALIGPRGAVVSFEPTPSTLTVLRENAARRPNVTVVPAAVWSARDELEFHDHGLGYSAYNSAFQARLPEAVRVRLPSNELRVEAVCLDDYVRESGIRADFVKIDAESAEAHVLSGMREMLARQRPVLSLEVGDLEVAGAPHSRELVETVIAAGYRVWELRDGEPVPHQPREVYDYQNLIFTPADRKDE
ncbi:FkbM family methyltransferase [Nocardia bovistercoris]|uniref:FkbM family methyltransferase n=1 Tax=Nocardia bovistercoris TaxID=2785916 RepID=A0A931IG70_9NOCA|nr:FkbM family methyltransferase [Nocardia bovistercoris]MBH0780854.1 FkbM family methyltransferase [Nocardia bovistercoris]